MGKPGGKLGVGAWRAIEELIRQALAGSAPVLLDSSVLIAYLSDEAPIARLVAPFLEHPAVEVVISTITLAESLVRIAREPHESDLNAIVSSIASLPNLRTAPFDREHAVEGEARTRLKFAGSAVIATACLANAVAVIGNDRG